MNESKTIDRAEDTGCCGAAPCSAVADEAICSATTLELSANEKQFRSMQLLACVKIMQALGIEPSDLSPCDYSLNREVER